MALQESQAAFWSALCTQRVGDDPVALLRDPWSQRTLFEAASDRLPTGYSGFLWRFPDHSRLIVTSGIVKASSR